MCSCPPFECLCATNQTTQALALSPITEVYGSSSLQVSPAGGEMIATSHPEYQTPYGYHYSVPRQPADYNMYQPPVNAQSWAEQAVSSLAGLSQNSEQSPTVYSSISQTGTHEYMNKPVIAYHADPVKQERSDWQTYAQDFFDDLEFNCVSDILSLDQPIDKSRDHVRSFVETSPSSPKKQFVDHTPNDSTSFTSTCSSTNSGSELFSQTPVKCATEWYSPETKPSLLVDVNCNDFSHIPQQQNVVPPTSSPVFAELKPFRSTPDPESNAKWSQQVPEVPTTQDTSIAGGVPVYIEKSAFLPYRQDYRDISESSFKTEPNVEVSSSSPVTSEAMPTAQDWQMSRQCVPFHCK